MASSRTRVVFAAALFAIGLGWMSGFAQRGQLPPGQTPPSTTGTGFIAGQVIESPSGRPIAGASVTIVGVQPGQIRSVQRPVLVDSQGRFFFADLPAGTYRLVVDKTGYAAASQVGQARLQYTLADAERISDVKARLVRLVPIAGVVRDETGDPVVGTDVIAFRRTLVNGRPILAPAGRGRTDDRGAYRVTDLRPGDYLVCACSRDPIPFDGVLLTTLAADPMSLMGVAARALKSGADVASLDSTLRTFAPTFYPGSTTAARATRVTLAPGEEKSAIDISVVSTRATRVSGAVVGATTPVTAASIRLVPAGESEEGASFAQLQPVLVQPDGRFDFAGVPPGQYLLRVLHAAYAGAGGPSGAALAFVGARGADMGGVGPPLSQPLLWAAEPVTVGEEGVRGLSIALRPGATIGGRVEFVGASPRPSSQFLARMAYALQSVIPTPARGPEAEIGRVTAGATFEIRGVRPGRYYLTLLASLPPWTNIKSVAVAGVDVTDLTIPVEASDINDLVITYSDTPLAALSGTLSGNAKEDLSVVVFPTDRRYWADPAAAARRLKTAPILRDGTFTIAGLPAGEYFVAVVPDDATVDWQDATRLESFSRAAQRVQLADGDKRSVSVRR